MKKVMNLMPLFLVGMMAFTIGCKKDNFRNPLPPDRGGNGQLSNAFRFTIDSLPGER